MSGDNAMENVKPTLKLDINTINYIRDRLRVSTPFMMSLVYYILRNIAEKASGLTEDLQCQVEEIYAYDPEDGRFTLACRHDWKSDRKYFGLTKLYEIFHEDTEKTAIIDEIRMLIAILSIMITEPEFHVKIDKIHIILVNYTPPEQW